MKKIMMMLAVVMGIFMVGCGKDKEEVVYVGTNAEFPPFEYLDGDQVVGFDIDLINEIALEAGFKVEIKDMAFDGLLPALQSKKVDVVIAGMTATEERAKAVNFTDSYYTASQVIVTLADNEEVVSFDTLKGKKVGVMLGFTGDLVVSEMEGVTTEKYNAAYAAIMALQAKKIDAVVLDSEPAKNFVDKNAGLKLIDGDAEKEEYAIAVGKGNEELFEKINKGLEAVKESGKYDELLKKHF